MKCVSCVSCVCGTMETDKPSELSDNSRPKNENGKPFLLCVFYEFDSVCAVDKIGMCTREKNGGDGDGRGGERGVMIKTE